jgi:outer membrane protein insertion porin family
MRKLAGRRPGAAALLAASVLVLAAGPLAAQPFAFDAVVVEGNERIDDASVASVAAIPQGRAVSGAELNQAFQNVLGSGLFENVEFEPRGSTLVIRVEERPTINVVAIEGNRQLDDETLLPVVGSTPRRVYTPAQAEADADAIAAAYAEGGRVSVSVTPRIIRRADNRVDLVFEVDETGNVEVERISFVGNRAFSDRRLRSVLATRQAGLLRQIVQADVFVPQRIAFDRQLLTDFYTDRGYVDFQVRDITSELSRERDAVFITVQVEEGQRYRFGRASVATDLPEVDQALFAREIAVRPGAVYSPVAVERTILRMEELALRRGIDFARIEPRLVRDPRNLLIGVVFEITRGPRVFVERIDIEGNNTTLDRVIRRQFDTVEGDPFNPRAIRAAAERIRALGYFTDAQVTSREGSSEGQVVVDVDVEETTTGSLAFGASFGADTGFGVSVGLRESNFLGRGQRLAFSVNTAAENASGSLRFFEPALLGRDLGGGLELFFRTTDDFNAAFDTRSVGFSPSVEFPTGEDSRLTLRYTIQSDDLSIDDEVDDGAERVSPILLREADRGELLTSSVGYTFTYDTRASGFNPDAGVLLRFSQDFAGLGGDTQYVSSTALASAFRRLARRDVTLRAELEGGAVVGFGDEDLRVTERFFTSGRSFRGFEARGIGPRDVASPAEDPLGGEYFAVARFEAGFPIGIPEEYGIRGGAFLDVGSVWGLSDTVGFDGAQVDDDFALRSTVGLALFVTTPIGPLRFNFTEAIQREDFDRERNFDLTISTEF